MKKKQKTTRLKKLGKAVVKVSVVVAIAIGITSVLKPYLFPEQMKSNTKKSAQTLDIIGKDIPDDLVEAVNTNHELIPFVNEYPTKKDVVANIDLRKEVKQGEIPYFVQWDERWGYRSYGGGLMALNGCGPTTLSMVLVYLTGNLELHPYAIAQYAQQNGYYEEGAGTSWSFMIEGANAFGVNAQELGLSKAAIYEQLRQNHPIICTMGPGDFTTTGHFILLTGIDKNGDITIHDSYRSEKAETSWSYETLAPQIRNLWVYDR